MSSENVKTELCVEGESAFRVSISYAGSPQQKPSQMIATKSAHANFEVVHQDGGVSLRTSFGTATLGEDTSFKMQDSKGNLLVNSYTLSRFDGTYLFALLSKPQEKQSIYYGAGADADAPFAHTHSTPTVSNQYGKGSRSWAPQYYSLTDGYAALAVGSRDFSNSTDYWTNGQLDWAKYPVNWTSDSVGATWIAEGPSVDLYLMPASDTYSYLKCHADLTGKPRVPPRYAFGFFAGRWGWTSENYISKTLKQFRDGNFPADAFICDFFFFTTFNDYGVGREGNSSYKDFGWNTKTFSNPSTQLKEYKKMGFHMGGIRKPRFGNPEYLDKLRNQGWLILPNLFNVNGQGRNINFTSADAKAWYQNENQHYLEDGVSFWWNDEGEVYFFQFHDWNEAQQAESLKFNSDKRFFTLNRAYTPGLQSMGVGVWTGDISVSWEAMAQQPGYMLNYNLAGNVYLGCDSGGFVGGNASAELLARWYWSSAFFTIMRVHSSFVHSEHGNAGMPITPHFPFLYGEEAARAMRNALEMRYRLIPMLYSLGHLAYTDGAPITRPLLMEFSTDSRAVNITDQWLVGTGVMTAPVLKKGGKRSVYFPTSQSSEVWFEFNSTATHVGGSDSNVQVPLDATPLYCRAGTLLPLGPVVQHTGQLPGPQGLLEFHVYAGRDGTFTLVEDDGETRAYETGAVRRTRFVWRDQAKTLSWTVAGHTTHESMFSKVVIKLFELEEDERLSTEQLLGIPGSFNFGKEQRIVPGASSLRHSGFAAL